MTLEQAVERVEAELGLLDRLWGREQKEPLNIHRFMEALSLVLARAKEPRVYALGEEERKQAGDLSRFRAAIDRERPRDELKAKLENTLEQLHLANIDQFTVEAENHLLKAELEKVREIVNQIRDVVIDKGPNDAEREDCDLAYDRACVAETILEILAKRKPNDTRTRRTNDDTM